MYDFDNIAKRCENWLKNHGAKVRAIYPSSPYIIESDLFIDSTMSCDPYEAIETAKFIMTRYIEAKTDEFNRCYVYNQYLAVYDIYCSLLKEIK